MHHDSRHVAPCTCTAHRPWGVTLRHAFWFSEEWRHPSPGCQATPACVASCPDDDDAIRQLFLHQHCRSHLMTRTRLLSVAPSQVTLGALPPLGYQIGRWCGRASKCAGSDAAFVRKAPSFPTDCISRDTWNKGPKRCLGFMDFHSRSDTECL